MNRTKNLYLLLLIIILGNTKVNSQQTTSSLKYPVTKKINQVDVYHGTSIADPYRWLENDTAQDVKAWVDAENKVTFDYLNTIPFRQKIKKRLTEILNYEKYSAPTKVGEYYIFSKNDGLQNQAVIYSQKGLDGTPSVFLDPNTMTSDGTAAITVLGASNDKKYIGYSINQAGSDWQTIKVKEIATGKELTDELKWVKSSGAAWYKDGFFYSRYEEPANGTELSAKNDFHKVWYHKLGTSQSSDKLIYEDKENPLRFHVASTTEDDRYLFIYVYQGTSGMQIMFKDLSKPNSKLDLLFKGFEHEYSIIDNFGSSIIFSTNMGAPNNHVLTVDLDNYKSNYPLLKQARILIPEKKSLLESANAVGRRLILNYLQDVASHVYQYTFEGVLENEIELPAIGTATGFSGSKDDREVFFSFTSFTYPSTIYSYNIDNRKVTEFRKPAVKFNPADYVTEQVFYPSKDGTKVPMFITYKKGLVKNAKNPTLLYAYGGFNVNQKPSFSASRIVFLENGGVFVLANIRGGGEYGDAWHKAGMRDKKQNVFDDFISAAEYLINKKYTSSSYLAIQGGSNGGLLVGAVVNQRPDLFKVAFPAVGVMDMLRFQKFTVGWGWVVEYGSSDSINDFNYLIKYSPLHTISDRKYPATMVTTADHDDRVVPAHSFKYVATLQEHQKGTAPVLIRIDVKAGHGAGKPLSKSIDETTDIYSFLFHNMGIVLK
jgi:prolyl oligopeptidase